MEEPSVETEKEKLWRLMNDPSRSDENAAELCEAFGFTVEDAKFSVFFFFFF